MYYDKIELSQGECISKDSYPKFELAKENSDFSNSVYIRKIFEDRGKIITGSWRHVKNKSQPFGYCLIVEDELNKKLCDGWTQNCQGKKKWATR